MIAFVKGALEYKDAEKAIIQTAGIGYELLMSVHTLADLPSVGETAQVWTYLQVKEDGMTLFGFSDQTEKQLFLQLIGVSGIGPKIAISALSTFKPSELASLIASGDVTAVSSISGIGKKTAQRLILELQGKLDMQSADADMSDQTPSSQPMKDAARALESMGFSSIEVSAALKGCTEPDAASIVRYALMHMGGAS